MDNKDLLPRQRDYLSYENHRNAAHAQLYADIVCQAFGHKDVIVGHHVTFEQHGDIKTENEVPSADTLLFDVDVARRVFGVGAEPILRMLATTPVEHRDATYAAHFYHRYPHLKRRAA